MTAALWERVKQITADALEREVEGRQTFVETACSGDPALMQEVQRLLAVDISQLDTLLSSPYWNVKNVLGICDSPQEPCFSPGQVVAGRFRIIQFLSRGGMGEVYSAVHLDLTRQTPVALKTIRPDLAAHPGMIERFKREVEQTLLVTHPNVCRVHEVFCHDQPPQEPVWFLTMTLLEGPTLAEHLASSGPMAPGEAVPLILDMVAALGAAHDQGIVHRDFKPSNVMLVASPSGRRQAVVTDFGLALSAEDDAGDHRVEGTPAYMSPEQAAAGPVTCAADQFALGLVICEMLTGSRPHLDRAAPGKCRRQLRVWLGSPVARPLRSPAKQAICRCLEFLPERRFPAVRDIGPVVGGHRRRRRIQRATAAGAIAAALLGIAVVAARQDWGYRLVDANALTSETDLTADPSISADGTWVAYESDTEGGNVDIWIQPAAGGAARRLTTDPAEDGDPSISPDGKQVAFRSERGSGGIYLINADGSGERLLVPGGRNPSFSPDGRSIAYWTGDPNEAVGMGQLWVVSADGRPPHRLAPDFLDARTPSWSPDGRLILFDGCDASGHFPVCLDWWVIQPDRQRPTPLGVRDVLRKAGIATQRPPVKVWWRDRILFNGWQGQTNSLWEIQLSSKTHRSAGQPRIVALGGGTKDQVPSVAAMGTAAYGRLTGALHVYRVSADPSGSQQMPVRVTDEPAADACPGVSRDGKRLFFARRGETAQDIRRRDLETRSDTVVAASAEDKFWPTPDATGSRVAFESRGAKASTIRLISPGLPVRTLCSDCAHPSSWLGEEAVFYSTAHGEIALVDAQTGATRVVLAPAQGAILGEPDWSPVHEFLLFTVLRAGAAKQLFAVRFRRVEHAPSGPWIPISSTPEWVDLPRWSSDGARAIYLSNYDGFYCLWGRGFDVRKGRPAGPALEIRPFHSGRWTPNRALPQARGLSVAQGWVYLNIGSVSASIRTARLTRPFLSRFFTKPYTPR